jgi:hypothetical protein
MISKDSEKYIYKGSSEDFVKGSSPDSCIEQLKENNPTEDSFFLSPDETTISHYRKGGIIDVLHKMENQPKQL